ncbi:MULTISPECIES: adenosylmethionine decarboxylase [Pseudomonas]|uniref:S-adenosylmethionine decarboxylase proenzyme n=1 Tax=Pseudomonas asplenii TaxID=53407 RepID=A0A0M9GJ10_9PSED|nr:adenosylmethionine decarboxylase [Pseudomonas fuscovaginae]KPA92105.1 S-adenosylmethionine decarboxylase proenzyme [Pseudomonas fuscovaginae]KPA95987.1 S-adenosylmethionine decarboxylase proenzyme [Pseudomonas fuscovaginae]
MNTHTNFFFGKHALGELYDVALDKLNDIDGLTQLLCNAAAKAGATVCGTLTKRFEPQGATILVLLEESHASFHTYPEHGALFLDIFTCGTSCDPTKAFDFIREHLQCGESAMKVVERGAI